MATRRRPTGSSRGRARRTSGSSPWPSPSATSTPGSTDASATSSKGERWTGFHAIEQRLWVERTTAGTRGLAREPRSDVARLRRLVRTITLEPAQIASGATELLGEVAKSKITGEEDRYSHTGLDDLAANVAGARAAFDAIRPGLRRPPPRRA